MRGNRARPGSEEGRWKRTGDSTSLAAYPTAKGHRWSAFSSHAVREMRRARVALSVTCRLEATSLTAGERSDTETVTLRSARGDWKRAIVRWYLASRLLNLGDPFQKRALMIALPVLFLGNLRIR